MSINKEQRDQDIINGMVAIQLDDPQKFSIVKETLTRIGIQNSERMKLFQSVHIFHKRGNYYLAHFKQMIALDGFNVDFTDEDYNRLLDIAQLLIDWGLVKPIDDDFKAPRENKFRVLKSSDAEQWELIPKFTIGKDRHHRFFTKTA